MKTIFASRWYWCSLITGVLILSSASVVLAVPSVPPCGQDTQITILNAWPADIAEGETYVVNIHVESQTPFDNATAKIAPYFPAYIHSAGGDRSGAGNIADLELQIIGARSTVNLPNGASPVTAYVGLRYGKGDTCAAVYQFDVAVH